MALPTAICHVLVKCRIRPSLKERKQVSFGSSSSHGRRRSRRCKKRRIFGKSSRKSSIDRTGRPATHWALLLTRVLTATPSATTGKYACSIRCWKIAKERTHPCCTSVSNDKQVGSLQ